MRTPAFDTLELSGGPAIAGEPLQLIASLCGELDESELWAVEFADGALVLGVAELTHRYAELSVRLFSTGGHLIVVTLLDYRRRRICSGELRVVVRQHTETTLRAVTLSGGGLRLLATVTGAIDRSRSPGGNVEFQAAPKVLATAPVLAGVACVELGEDTGTETIATYLGDAHCLPSRSMAMSPATPEATRC